VIENVVLYPVALIALLLEQAMYPLTKRTPCRTQLHVEAGHHSQHHQF
jgi:hypothetical protein